MNRTWLRILLGVGMLLVLFNGWLVYRIRQTPEPPLPRLIPPPAFELTDSTASTRSDADLRGKVWLANFIFTRCAGPCPLMTEKMSAIQEAVANLDPPLSADQVQFVSISVDPGYDTPEVLRAYAAERGLDLSNWWLLTGPRESTVELIRKGFGVAVGSPPPRASTLIHATLFLLFDQQGWARAIFHLEDPELVESATAAIARLVRRPDPEPLP